MILKPQDILVVLKLVVLKQEKWTYNGLSVDLFMSPSEVHAAVKRAINARLLVDVRDKISVSRDAIKEFLVHGIKYVFMPERGEITRGMPTIYTVPPLDTLLFSSDEPRPVWPHPTGEIRGTSFSPLYRSAPDAARKDQDLYSLLALVDAIRGGRAREREVAAKHLKHRIDNS